MLERSYAAGRSCAAGTAAHFFDGAFLLISAGSAANEHGRSEAENGNDACQYPGAFFQYVSGLAHAHHLVAETAEAAGQAAAFGVLYQHKEAQ